MVLNELHVLITDFIVITSRSISKFIGERHILPQLVWGLWEQMEDVDGVLHVTYDNVAHSHRAFFLPPLPPPLPLLGPPPLADFLRFILSSKGDTTILRISTCTALRQ